MEEYINILGKRVRYIKKGKGEPLILLHGLGGSLMQWSENIDELAEHFMVYAVEFPGFGQSSPMSAHELNISFVPMFMEECRKKFGIEKLFIVGGSLGGICALDYALYFPDRVKALVLVNSAGLGSEIAWSMRLATIPPVGEVVRRMGEMTTDKNVWFWKFTSFPLVGTVLQGLYEWVEREHLRRSQISAKNKKLALQVLRYGVNLFGQKKTIDRSAMLKHLSVPTFIIWGAEDKMFPVAHAERAAELIPNAQLYIFKNVGHWPPSEAPVKFNTLVRLSLLSK